MGTEIYMKQRYLKSTYEFNKNNNQHVNKLNNIIHFTHGLKDSFFEKIEINISPKLNLLYKFTAQYQYYSLETFTEVILKRFPKIKIKVIKVDDLVPQPKKEKDKYSEELESSKLEQDEKIYSGAIEIFNDYLDEYNKYSINNIYLFENQCCEIHNEIRNKLVNGDSDEEKLVCNMINFALTYILDEMDLMHTKKIFKDKNLYNECIRHYKVLNCTYLNYMRNALLKRIKCMENKKSNEYKVKSFSLKKVITELSIDFLLQRSNIRNEYSNTKRIPDDIYNTLEGEIVLSYLGEENFEAICNRKLITPNMATRLFKRLGIDYEKTDSYSKIDLSSPYPDCDFRQDLNMNTL